MMDAASTEAFHRTKKDFCTPDHVLKPIWALGPIVLDPCSNPWSSVGAAVELSAHRGDDGLQVDWDALVLSKMPSLDSGGLVFVNPPYGRGCLPVWTRKVLEEARRGVEIVALVPASLDTSWWSFANSTLDARCDWRGRIAFEGGEHGSGQFASSMLYWGPRRYLFAHLFEPHGEIRVYDRRRAA